MKHGKPAGLPGRCLRTATLRQMEAIEELGWAVEAKDREHTNLVAGLQRELREAQLKNAALVEERAQQEQLITHLQRFNERERPNARALAQNERDLLGKVAELTEQSAEQERMLALQENMIEVIRKQNARLKRLVNVTRTESSDRTVVVDEQGTRG